MKTKSNTLIKRQILARYDWDALRAWIKELLGDKDITIVEAGR